MTLIDLIDAFRIKADDIARPYLWSDDEVTLFLNEAQKEAATRALLIQDKTSPLVVNIDVLIGTNIYKIHESILEILQAKLSNNTELEITSLEALSDDGFDIDNATGTPQYLFENGDGTITITPTPTVADTISLVVKRSPLCSMAKDSDKPEIHSRYHFRMIDWALHLAYLKPDADVFNASMAERYKASFEASFGIYNDANVQRKHREKSRNVVRSSW